MRILILEMGESEESILQDIFSLLSGKVKFQFMELSGSAEPCKNLETSILTVSDLEIHVREQTVYKAGVLIPMSHYEFSPSATWQNTLAGCSANSRSMRRSGRKRMVIVMPPSPMLSVKSERN